MCAAEVVCRLLAFLDGRGRADGDISDLSDEDIEWHAGWTGEPGVLVRALIQTKWIDRAGATTKWHDYASFNSTTIARRAAGKNGGRRSVETRRSTTGTAQPGRRAMRADAVASEANAEANAEQSGSGDSPSENPQGPCDAASAPLPPHAGKTGEIDVGPMVMPSSPPGHHWVPGRGYEPLTAPSGEGGPS